VHCRCVPQWNLGVLEDARQTRFVHHELAHVPTALGLVALVAGEREVRDAIRTALASRVNVINFQRHVQRVAVGASPPPLLAQVLADLVPGERGLLVLHAVVPWVAELLGVEANELDADRLARREAPQALHPREGGVGPVPQTWSGLALGPGAVL